MFVSLVALALVLPAVAATNGGQAKLLSDSSRAYLDQALKRWGIPGFTMVAVASPQWTNLTGDAGWVTEYYNYGVADKDGNPVTEDTLFGIASNSKLFTALSVLHLIANGSHIGNNTLTPRSKAKDVLPGWGLMDQYASEHVDMIDLWGMRSGLPGHGLTIPRGATNEEVLAKMRHLKQSAEIRQAFQYNNHHYAALSQVVTTATGSPYVDWIQSNIFDPLGMSATTFNYTGLANLADGFAHIGVNGKECALKSTDLDHLDPSCVGTVEPFGWWNSEPYRAGAGAGYGGILTSSRDLGKWFKELLAPQVLNPEAVKAAELPVSIVGPALPGLGIPNYGAGQEIMTYGGQKLLLHTGIVEGQHSLFMRLPDRGLALGMMTNDGLWGNFLMTPLSMSLADEILGFPVTDWERLTFDGFRMGATQPGPTAPQVRMSWNAEPEGTYSHPAYGNFTLEPMPAGEANSAQDQITRGLAQLGLRNVPTEIMWSPVNWAWYTHVTLTHWHGELFNLTAWPVYEYGGKVVIPTPAPFPAVVTEAGMGVFGGLSEPGLGIPPSQWTQDGLADATEVENAAEVYFARI